MNATTPLKTSPPRKSRSSEAKPRKRAQSRSQKTVKQRAERVTESFEAQPVAPEPLVPAQFFLVTIVQWFLWLCGGFDRAILTQNACRTVRPKYAMMGLSVCVTTAFAFFSSRYFFSTMLEPWQVNYAAGLWATAIFTLDRYIVTSTRKYAAIHPYRSDRRKTQPIRVSFPWTNALPRLLLASVISLVVAAPFEVSLQKSRIATAREEMVDKTRAEWQYRIDQEKANATSDRTTKIDADNAELKRLRDAFDNANTIAVNEADGSNGTGKVGLKTVYARKQKDADRAQQKLDATEATLVGEIADLKRQNTAAKDEIDAKYETRLKALENDHSFSADFETLRALRVASPAINLMSWGLVLVFLALELTPVLAKLFSQYDPVDSYLQNHEWKPVTDNLRDYEDAYLNYDVHVSMRKAAATYLVRNTEASLQDAIPSSRTLTVISNRASSELQNAASNAVRYKPQTGFTDVPLHRPHGVAFILRTGGDRIMAILHKIAEFLRTSFSAVELYRWIERKLFP
jgi:hypothetical protein